VKGKKWFDREEAFRLIWENAGRDGIWLGDAADLAEEFDVSEDAAEEVLDELRDRRLIEKLYTGAFFISGWREKDEVEEP
jgi:DNA-binding FadR family transcriptional regulator